MKKRTNVRAFLLLLVCSGGCTRLAPVGSRAEPIIGGKVTTGDPGVVLIRASQGNGYSLCSGEIVSQHVVMTAAHCTDPSEIGSGNTFDVFIGSDFNGAEGNDPAKWLAVQETHYNPNFSGNNLGGGQDVGVVILQSATTIAPLPMNRTAITDANVGQPVRIVGFGNNNGQQGTGAGTRRVASTPLTGYDSLFITFGDQQYDTCQGDSGGPAFMTLGGAEVIVGVTSFGPPGCTGGATDTRVDTVALAFVDPYIQQFDPANSAPPDLAQPPAPPADLAQAPSASPDMANNGNGGGGNGNGDAGHINLGGGGSGGDSGRSTGGCSMGGRAAGAGAFYFMLLTLIVLVRRRGRARY